MSLTCCLSPAQTADPAPHPVPIPALHSAEPTVTESEIETSPGQVARLRGRIEASIRTLEELVAFLGGASVVARDCDVPLSDIDRWIRQDAMPRGFHMRFFARAIIAGGTFEAMAMQRLFGLSAEDASAFCQVLAVTVPHFQYHEGCDQ